MPGGTRVGQTPRSQTRPDQVSPGGRELGGPDLDEGDPLGDLAAAAGFQIESFGKLPLLHYIVAVRPQASRGWSERRLE